ncbi:sulfate adenylyltransferase [Thioflexithrix psekupsensis]|uniref:Sulfate adenylyltransferase n=1 Tax=Thioflexithrix psekupsensis TaxID=1570016 RepID=A0A251X6W7_9GAMM|nr:sulfate adenylyltransferase [Thioflexithrix psekupsensis]OUD13819.1 sulfate adenylyltransferase [Thioflexithrix psekupsensis]
MIRPYATDFLMPLWVADPARRAQLEQEAQTLPKLLISSAAAANAVMLGGGYFTPLTGYMNVADTLSVADQLKTQAGLFWPIPIVNIVPEVSGITGATRIALCDPNQDGQPVIAVQTVAAIETLSDAQMQHVAQRIFATDDVKHPGYATFMEQGRYVVSGAIEVLNFSYFQTEFPDTFRTAVAIREEIQQRGWQTVVAFQTRNPMHRAHEELCKMAQAAVNADGVLIHMLLGKLKPGDIPADVRDASIRKMVELYFPENSVMVTGYGFDMLYAGPREAVLHAIFRQNAGCTHFIVGRDHAGVGSYYGPFDAQTIFDDSVPAGTLDIEIFKADHTAYSKKLGRVVMMCDVPDHQPEDFIMLSGTKVREILSAGELPPPEFTRPEVAKILMAYYQNTSD